MNNILIGRKEEQAILRKALQSNEAEMVAVIGRRRVGKTFLVRTAYKSHIIFEITGAQDAPLKEQLENFRAELTHYVGAAYPIKQPATWSEAFLLLRTYLQQQLSTEKKVIFLDELPWLAKHKSGFLRAFGYFWNSWAVKQNIVVVICGSSASWMIKRVVNNKGGLYNRITKRIFLKPFTLAETEEYLNSRHFNYDRYQITQLYMALGGIPHHLKEVELGKSAIQNIDDICFSESGLLKDEFNRLYPSLFANAEKHIIVIRILAGTQQGLTRSKIVQLGKLPEGGNTSKLLEELEQSGFITSYFPFGKKKKDKLYRLTDEYSLFYLKFMENNANEGRETWQHLSQTQTYKTWSGYAFESICLKHIPQIKKALGIAGVYSQSSTFLKKDTDNEKGTQIDLLIDRNDQVINIFEIKFYNTEISITASYAKTLREKMRVFQETTKTRKYLMTTLLTTFGLKQNKHSLGLIEKVITLDDLFEK